LSIFRYSTPLHDAVCCGRQQVAQILVERGANVNELDYKNMTPLKLAVRSENLRVLMQFVMVGFSDMVRKILRLC
jgi:ankyrin repeat protein